MAGLLGDGQVLVDVVRAAYRLVPPPEIPAGSVPADEQVPPDRGLSGPRTCPLGHSQPSGVRFCGMCGLDMSAPAPAAVTLEDARPKPAGMLTPEERTERDRLHVAAMAAAAQFEQAPQVFEPSEPGSGQTVVIHFLEDGLTAFGKVWYRGEELEIGPDHSRWAEARQWILLDKWAQYDRYGKQYFDAGPWPGQRGYAGARFEQLSTMDRKGKFAGPTAEELAQAEQAAARRGRAVPAPAFR